MLFILTFLARSIDLELSATANLSYAYRRGGTYLEWTNIKDQDIYYKLYQKSKDSNGVWSDWKQCSTYNKGSKIKVLNIYPSQFDGTNGTKAINASIYETYKVYFKFTNETQERELPKSASLKLWMEGGTLIENGVKTKIEGFGIDPDTNLQIIFVDIISINDFETNITVDKSFIYNYDVIFFGTWDGSAGYSIKRITAQNVIYEYLKKGYSVFAGHDCLTRIFVENHQATGLLALRNYFGIKLDYLDYNYGTNYTTFVSDEISIQRKGLLTNYPYEIGDIGRILKVPRTHTYYHAATGDVWISLNNEGVHEDKNGLKHNFYLTTKDNTAVIQTGHSNCEASEDERKIIANTIYYFKTTNI
ncbi:DUF5057 domain-containing protein [Histomonas meleagridis]|nr:DUF5057 domain-containing protein [Histomonas meleagridis]